MHSVILSCIYSFFIKLFSALPESGIWRWFCGIYEKVSSSFSKSFIVNWFTSDGNGGNTVVKKVCRFPFFILECISSKIGLRYKEMIEKSIIIDLCRSYFHGFAGLNTRFFGAIAAGAGISYFAVNAVLGAVSVKALILLVIGIILCLANFNIMSFLDGSCVVRFVKNAAGFSDLKFNFFDAEAAQKRTGAILGFLTGLVSGVAAVKSLLLLPLVPCTLFGAFLVLGYPIAGVFAAVFAAPFIPTMVLAALCMFVTGALVLNKLAEPDYRWKTGNVGTAVILLLAILFVTSVLSFAPVKSLMVWAMYLVFFVFYFVVINSVNTKEQIKAILKIFVISGAFVALYGIIQYVFKIDTTNAWIDEEMFEEATMRAYSTLENPNVLGEYLLLILPLAAIFMIRFKVKEWSKWVYTAIFAVCGLCLIFTQSRGCWLGFILSVVIFVTFYKGKLWCLVPFAILLLPLVLPETMIARIMSIGDMSDSSTSYRVYIWYGTFAMLKTYWIGGIGMGEGAFDSVYPFYSYNAVIAPHSHNLYLQLVVEAGVGALIVFIAAMIMLFRNSSNICRNSEKNSFEYITSLAFACGVSGFLLQSMFDYTFYNYRVMAMFMMYLALAAALKYCYKESGKK